MSDGDFQIEIDGRTVNANRGEMIIHVADREGVNIPRFCYHEKLSIAANCRMCLVQVEKAPKPLPACATPVMDGMKISTQSDYARQAQKSVMEFLLINHPLDCPICDQGGECELQDLAIGYGEGVSRFAERKRVVKDKNLGALIATDMTRCIHCTRCVRFGDEIAGMPELGSTGRGENLEIGTYIEKAVASELSGNVIDVCPVGALTSKPFRYRARTWEMQSREALAPHDPVGSNIFVHIAQKKVMRVVPRRNDDVNETWISDRDRFSYEGMYTEDRLKKPALRDEDDWADVDWEDAIAVAAERLRAVIDEHGVDQIGVLASPSATTEELYLLQKVARGLGIKNIDHRLREADLRDQDDAPAFWSLGRPIAELETVGAALVVGSNARKEFPLVNHRLRKASRAGAAVRFMNAVDYPTNFDTAAGRIVSPGSWVSELAGIVRAAATTANESVDGLPDVDVDDWHRAVAGELQSAEQSAVILGALAAAHPRAAELRALAARLSAITGASSGMVPQGANQAGAALAGVLPHRGPGGKAVDAGMNVREMLARPRKAYILMGLEADLDCLDGGKAREALRQAECVISLTGFDSPEQRELTDILLPIGLFAETDGSFVNAGGNWQAMNAAVMPLGDARPAWKILRVLGNTLGLDGFDFMRCESVRTELRSQITDLGIASLPLTNIVIGGDSASEAQSLWSCAETPMYAIDPLVRRAGALHRTPDAEWGSSNCAELNPEQAAVLGVEDGQTVRVTRSGISVELTARVDAAVAMGCVRVPSGISATASLGGAHAPVTIQLAS
jgi:NADH-quinone oxidoreductase subunit G